MALWVQLNFTTVCRFISLQLQLTPCLSHSFVLLKFRNWGWWACLKVWNGEISSKVAPDSTDVFDHQAGIIEYQEWTWLLGYMGFFRQWSISFSMAWVIDLSGRHCEDCPLESGDLWLIPPKKLISLPHGGIPILSPSTFPYVSQLTTRLQVLKAVGALRHQMCGIHSYVRWYHFNKTYLEVTVGYLSQFAVENCWTFD